MGAPSRPSASVIAAGVVAIIGSLITLAGAALGIFGLAMSSAIAAAPPQPPVVRIMGFLALGFGFLCGIAGIASAVGLFLLRNWARLACLVWAGICFFFGIIGIPVSLFMPLPMGPGSAGLPGHIVLMFRLILLGVYGVPLVVGIWWLILFTRTAVKDQFMQPAAAAQSGVDFSSLAKPKAPVAITVIAWFFISSVANLLFLPILPPHVPAILFGRLIYPPGGTVILVVTCLLLTFAGIGLLKLKPWGYFLVVGLQLLWVASGLITALTPNIDRTMARMIAQMLIDMHFPANVPMPAEIFEHTRLFMSIGLIIPVVIIVILFYYRDRYFDAASSAHT
ncbi:MAG TPA: hypothetical protein VJN93_11695 [Candidatus Acidoferrum sp.]|nr:hypothetical protein [Candidatus Acidoferrum sp.]